MYKLINYSVCRYFYDKIVQNCEEREILISYLSKTCCDTWCLVVMYMETYERCSIQQLNQLFIQAFHFQRMHNFTWPSTPMTWPFFLSIAKENTKE